MANARSASAAGAGSRLSVVTVTVRLSAPSWVPMVPTSVPAADWVAVSAQLAKARVRDAGALPRRQRIEGTGARTLLRRMS